VNGRARRSYGQTDSGATALSAEAARRSGVLADLPVHRVDGHLQRVDHGQVVVDHLAGGGGQLQSGELGPAGAAPAPGRPVMAVVGQTAWIRFRCRGPQPHQLNPVPQQRPQLPHLSRRDPRLGEQVGAGADWPVVGGQLLRGLVLAYDVGAGPAST